VESEWIFGTVWQFMMHLEKEKSCKVLSELNIRSELRLEWSSSTYSKMQFRKYISKCSELCLSEGQENLRIYHIRRGS